MAGVLTEAKPASPGGADFDRALVDRVIAAASRTALGVLGDRDAAADVAQEVLLQAFSQRARLREPDALMGWVHRVSVRIALKEARRSRRRRAAEQARAALPSGPDEPESLERTLAAIDALSPRQRAALTLRYVHDLPDEAIARALRCRPATVRSLLSRGRDAVRAGIDEETP